LDSAACWKQVLDTPEGQQQARSINDARAVGAVLGGGVLAAAYLAANESADKPDPKKDHGNWLVHDGCMQRKGYRPRFWD
jgi:hypothetical protein